MIQERALLTTASWAALALYAAPAAAQQVQDSTTAAVAATDPTAPVPVGHQATSATQQTTPGDQSATGDPSLGDIVVTAERRTSTVREVPFSIAAFGGEQLRTAQVFSASALTQQLPGVTVNTADKSLSIVAIRGNVSTFRTATLDTPVAFFVDDVYYVFNNDVNSNFYDLSRVEVLRGPQGTLFGRNVVGGALAIITNNPEFDTDYFGQVTAGNAGYIRTEGMLNGVLVDDKLAGRFAFSTESADGRIDTPNQKGSYGKTDGYSARGKLLLTPTDNLKILLAADYSYTKGNGGAIQLGIGGENQTIPQTFGNFKNDKWTNNDYARSPYAQRLRGGLLRADLDIFGGALTSITGYRLNDSRAINDDVPVGTIMPVFDRRQQVKNRSFTQEVRFASAPNRFSYVVGAYFLSADVSTTNTFLYSPLPGSAVPVSVRRNPGVTNITRVQDGDITSFAVFGEGTFAITDKLSLVAGGRYTKDKKDIDYHAFSTTDAGAIPGFGFPGEVRASGGKSWNAFTPRVTLKYKPLDAINLYATWARGFKSGGFVDNAYLNPTIPLEPERATNIEGGLKSRFLDNKVDVNLSIFRQKTQNLQNFSGAGGVAHTFNGTLVMKGAELETVFRPITGARISFNYTHLVGKYTSLLDPLVNLDYSGNPAKFAPRDAFTINGSYDARLRNGATLTPQADFNFSTAISTDDANILRTYRNLYEDTRGRTLNARLTYDAPGGKWSMGAWVKNVTNNYQIVNADDITAFLTVPSAATRYWKVFTNTPRTFGATLSIKR
jgi:iron complex outermembrane receptor protein